MLVPLSNLGIFPNIHIMSRNEQIMKDSTFEMNLPQMFQQCAYSMKCTFTNAPTTNKTMSGHEINTSGFLQVSLLYSPDNNPNK